MPQPTFKVYDIITQWNILDWNNDVPLEKGTLLQNKDCDEDSFIIQCSVTITNTWGDQFTTRKGIFSFTWIFQLMITLLIDFTPAGRQHKAEMNGREKLIMAKKWKRKKKWPSF